MKYLFLMALIVSLSACAQTEDAVKKPIMQLFDGMRKSDINMIRSAFAPMAIMQTIIKNEGGKTEVRTESVNDFIASFFFI